jgi:Tfp pilus assembly protein PilO
MTVILILIAIIFCLIAAFIITISVLKKQVSENKKLKKEIKVQQQNSIYLYKHAQEISEITSEANKLEGKINNAKTDEEIIDIINSVISNNNSKL